MRLMAVPVRLGKRYGEVLLPQDFRARFFHVLQDQIQRGATYRDQPLFTAFADAAQAAVLRV